MQLKRINPLSYILALVFLIKTTSIKAQEQLGLRLDNYAGINALVLNPAANATNPLTWDINLVGFGAWGNTNIGYLGHANIPKALNNIYNIGPNPALNLSHKGTPSLLFYINDRTNYGLCLGGRVMGPSVAFKLKNGHSFGFFTGVRAMLSSHNLPSILNPSEFNSITFNKSFNINPFKVAGLSWSELGLNYAYQFDTDTEGGVTIGANVKYMQGFQSFFLNNYKGTSAAQNNKETYQVNSIRATTGFTTNYDTNPLQQNGHGLGFDIGVVIKTDGGTDRPYGWRLGASLIDLGSVTISNSAEIHSFNTNEAFKVQTVDFDSVSRTTNPRVAVLAKVDEKISTAQNNTLVNNTFLVGLPSAIQVQADYAFTNNVYINALVIQRFKVNEVALERDNIMALTPRFESRWLGASMPFLVTNMEKMQVGFNARLAFLSLGTDNLFSWIGNGKLSGTDFYMAIKVNPFHLNFLNLGGSRGGKKVSCYRF